MSWYISMYNFVSLFHSILLCDNQIPIQYSGYLLSKRHTLLVAEQRDVWHIAPSSPSPLACANRINRDLGPRGFVTSCNMSSHIFTQKGGKNTTPQGAEWPGGRNIAGVGRTTKKRGPQRLSDVE